MSNHLATIQRLTRYRWSLPVMAELWHADGCKFVTLVRTLHASDKAIRQALDYLIAQGWVMRNPGYGHPWRPEYILTDEGVSLGRLAHDTLDLLQESGVLAAGRWELTLLALLFQGPTRFSEWKRQATHISPRAHSLAVRALIAWGMVERSVVDLSPPAVVYSLTERGRQVAVTLGKLNRL